MSIFERIRNTVSYFEDTELVEILDSIKENNKEDEFNLLVLDEAEEEEKDGYQSWYEELCNLWSNPMGRFEDFRHYGRMESVIRKGGKLVKA